MAGFRPMIPSFRPVLTIYTCISLLLLAAFFYYLVSSVISYRRLRHFKGPPQAAWSQLWYIRAAMSGKCHLMFSDVSTEHGSLARIAPNMLITSDEELFKRVNTPRSGYSRPDFYKAFRFTNLNDNVFSETDGDRHQSLRKRVAPAYSGRDQPNFEAVVDNTIQSFIKSWETRYISTGSHTIPVDFAQQIQYMALEVISMLCFSEPLGWIRGKSDRYGYCEILATSLRTMSLLSAIPFLERISRIPWLRLALAPSKKDATGVGRIMRLIDDNIARHFAKIKSKESKMKPDMISAFISHGLSHSDIHDHILLSLVAGSDTTATILRTGLASILTNPRILRKLQIEADHADVSKDEIISNTRAQDLPYLQACIKESLRHHPPAAGASPRVVPPGGDYYKGQFIPGGTLIAQCAWNIFRKNYDVFGSDADVFRPERWLEAAAAARDETDIDLRIAAIARLERMERTVDLVFSYGEYRCLGPRLALMEIGKTLFELIRRFEFGFMDGLNTMNRSENYNLFVQDGMWVRCELR